MIGRPVFEIDRPVIDEVRPRAGCSRAPWRNQVLPRDREVLKHDARFASLAADVEVHASRPSGDVLAQLARACALGAAAARAVVLNVLSLAVRGEIP